MKREIKPYGSWNSPVSSAIVASGGIRLEQVTLEGKSVYWIEGRPAEGGRSVICKYEPPDLVNDAIAADFNARTRVHEYGGGAYVVDSGEIYFCNFADNQIWAQKPQCQPKVVTAESGMRYADLICDRRRNRLIAVGEDHGAKAHEPVNSIVGVDLANGQVTTLTSGNDFYSSARLSPDGKRLAWLTWNHPNMPWDGNELWAADVADDGSLCNAAKIAGVQEESIVQPEWSPDGTLYFVSDATGWWNLYRSQPQGIQAVTARQAEFGRPAWVFGMSSYAFCSHESLICTFCENGVWQLAKIDLRTLDFTIVKTPCTDISYLRAHEEAAYFCGGSPTQGNAVMELQLDSGALRTLRRSSNLEIDTEYLSPAQTIEFPTSNGKTAYGFFYAPQNKDYEGPAGQLPPLLVKSHGGPTSATSSTMNASIQYWTSRGIAVLDVNYGGSTGFGTSYRKRLNGNWGIVDVEDCTNGALYLAQHKLVDANKMAISGGSAGGFTTLCALVFGNTFKAGASYYGVSDLIALELDTHKFESKYLHSMVGAYPEQEKIYKSRSPINSTHKLCCPMIFFQGLEDKVVPPGQSEAMVEALRKKGLPVAYLTFEAEQHGFRRSETIRRCLEAELYFYSRIFGFDIVDPVQPVEIENAP